MTENADHILVVSFNPIVLGNMPEEGKESDYEKVAFMGQVPVKVFGEVNVGDFILASGFHNGLGTAVSPDDIEPDQYCKIVGTAWSGSDSLDVGFVNLAVGLNANDMARLNLVQEEKITAQEYQINALEKQLALMNAALEQVLPEYYALMNDGTTKSAQPARIYNDSYQSDGEMTIIYHEISREHIEEGIAMAKQILIDKIKIKLYKRI